MFQSMTEVALDDEESREWSEAARRTYAAIIKRLEPSSRPANLTMKQARKAVRDYNEAHKKA